MRRGYKFDIRIDFEKSHNSYLYDKKRNRYFLDFFGFYSSLPLGYNHEIFKDKEFIDTIKKVSNIKVANDSMETDEKLEFVETFTKYQGMDIFKYFHFCCTGALAIESAVKVAIDHKECKKPVVISFKGDFHGINSWGLASDRFPPIDKDLGIIPEVGWPKVKDIDEIKQYIRKNGSREIAAILIEPIQSTFGDRYFPGEFFIELRKLCNDYNIPLIFDEIQTGFGVTGKMWYYQHLDIEPDIVAFGKKSQVAGIMVKKHFGKTFESPIKRLEVTFDGELLDMIRCTFILKAYMKYNILENVNKRSDQWFFRMKDLDKVKNVRKQGLLMAFDLPSQKLKDKFAIICFKNQFLVSPASYNCIRFRPNLNVSSVEIEEALTKIKKVLY